MIVIYHRGLQRYIIAFMTWYFSYILSYVMLGLLLVPGCYGNYGKMSHNCHLLAIMSIMLYVCSTGIHQHIKYAYRQTVLLIYPQLEWFWYFVSMVAMVTIVKCMPKLTIYDENRTLLYIS